MRIVARNAIDPRDRAGLTVPMSARATMSARLPIAVSRSVAASAQRRAVGEFQLAAITSLQQLKIGFIVAIETKIVSVMAAVAHHEVTVFFWNDEIVIVIETERWWFVALVTGVTIEIREILFSGNQLCVRNPNRVIARERRIYQRYGSERWRATPKLKAKGRRKRQE